MSTAPHSASDALGASDAAAPPPLPPAAAEEQVAAADGQVNDIDANPPPPSEEYVSTVNLTRMTSLYCATHHRTGQALELDGRSEHVADTIRYKPPGHPTGRAGWFGHYVEQDEGAAGHEHPPLPQVVVENVFAMDPKGAVTAATREASRAKDRKAKARADAQLAQGERTESAAGSSSTAAPVTQGDESGESDDDEEEVYRERYVLPAGALRNRYKCGGEMGGCPGCRECIEDHPDNVRPASPHAPRPAAAPLTRVPSPPAAAGCRRQCLYSGIDAGPPSGRGDPPRGDCTQRQ